ncbi:MAG: VOC family protein, partial [Proteobacteria bacterium]|nr:VOC family protein [Pseudomonadota bacterium]
MPSFASQFVWFELLASDAAAAKRFYGSVAGWGSMPGPVPDMDYTLFTAGGAPVGGVMPLPEQMRQAGAPPHWTGVIGVANVDEAAEKAVRLGGAVRM